MRSSILSKTRTMSRNDRTEKIVVFVRVSYDISMLATRSAVVATINNMASIEEGGKHFVRLKQTFKFLSVKRADIRNCWRKDQRLLNIYLNYIFILEIINDTKIRHQCLICEVFAAAFVGFIKSMLRVS